MSLQEEVQFMASLGDFQEAMPPGNVRTRATFLQRYAEVTHLQAAQASVHIK